MGLTNLSWLLIQSFRQLPLDESKKQWCIEKAFEYADRAVHILEKSGDSGNSSINTWLFRGLALMDLKKYDQALKNFEDALKRSPDHPSLLRRRADTLEKLGRKEEAFIGFEYAEMEFIYRIENEDAPSNYSTFLNGAQGVRESKQKLASSMKQDPKLTTIMETINSKKYKEALKLTQENKSEKWGQDIFNWFQRHFSWDEEGNIMPKAREDLLKILGIYQYPSPYELLHLSAGAYAATRKRLPFEPAHWEFIDKSENVLRNKNLNGYVGAAFTHKETFTDWTDPQDLVTDANSQQGKMFDQLIHAREFTNHTLLIHKNSY